MGADGHAAAKRLIRRVRSRAVSPRVPHGQSALVEGKSYTNNGKRSVSIHNCDSNPELFVCSRTSIASGLEGCGGAAAGMVRAAVETVRSILAPLMLRRHGDEIGEDGKLLLPLPPLTIHTFKLQLTYEERLFYQVGFPLRNAFSTC